MSFDAIRENKIIAKISGFTVHPSTQTYGRLHAICMYTPGPGISMWDNLSSVAKMAWDVLSGMAKMA